MTTSTRPRSALFRAHVNRDVRAVTLVMVVLGAVLLAAGTSFSETIRVASGSDEAGISLRAQSSAGVEIHFGVSEFGLDPLEIEGLTYQKISLREVFLPSNAGAPDLPGVGRFLALPQGATARLRILSSRSVTYPGIEVAPAPVIPRETDTGPLVYQRDASIYQRDALYPPSPVLISQPGKLRGVDVIRIGITPFQYNPITKDLIVYTDLDVRVDFEGGNGQFGEDRLRSRWWEPILANHLLNHASLSPASFDEPLRDRQGFEYVIICPDNPDFIPWAQTLRDWRQRQGIYTGVFTTTDVGGTTATAIENFLNNAYNNWELPPAAFLLLGDYPGTGLLDQGITSPVWSSYCVSDNIYADVDGDDLPDMVSARITARNSGELETMIGKMLTYETTPPMDAGFYDHPIIAGGWQTERWFILCAEICYGHQANVLGKSPVREYAIYSGSPGTSWSSNPNTSMLVNYFGPTGLGYIPATPSHLTDWGSNATRVNNSINAGAYFLLHRDHGAETGWGEPNYGNGSLSGLHNGELLPFVFSMNCLTGKYNWSSQSFTEAFHRMAQGALGLVAASEISYSFVNDTYVFGLFDTMWPEFMPTYGPFEPQSHFATDLRPAFGQASGKYFLEASNWPYNPGDKTVTYHLFHHHGDAFLTLFSEVPQPLTVQHDPICLLGVSSFSAQAEAGSVIALTVDNEIIGVAHATGLMQAIPIIPQAAPGMLHVTVTKANRLRYEADVSIIPPDGPYLVVNGCAVLDPMGDDDGQLDAAEDAELAIVLENVGVDGTTGVTATIACEDPLVSLITASSPYPDIPAGGLGTALDPYQVQVSGAAPDQHVLSFDVHAQSIDGQWDGSLQLVVQAPVIWAGGPSIDDSAGDDDGVADPGETVLVSLGIGNSGHSATGELVGTLQCLSPYIHILDGEAGCAAIPVGGQAAMGSWQMLIDPGCPAPLPVSFSILVQGAGGFQTTMGFALDVGGWFDDVETDRGWTLGHSTDTASSGRWVRAEPVGTIYNGFQAQPEYDHTPDPAQICFVTGNGAAGGAAGDQDVDGGKTTLLTPIFELGDAQSATVSFYYWYTNNLGNNPGQDYWDVDVTSDGATWVHLQHTTESPNAWTFATFELTEHVEMSDQVQLRFVAADDAPGTLVEAAVDDFTLIALYGAPIATPALASTVAPGIVSISPNPFNPQARIAFQMGARGPVELTMYDIAGRRVSTLVDGVREPGQHVVTFDGHDARGRAVGSGVYFLRLKTPEVLQIKQITLVK